MTIDPQEEPVTDLAVRPEIEVDEAEEELDAELLEEAQRQISARSPNAVLNEALRRLVEAERAKRRAAGEILKRMADDGELDFSVLDEVDE